MTSVNKQKDLGQVFTPKWVVELILDKIKYTSSNSNIVRQTILEPSFGNGAFFYPLFDRFIEASCSVGKTPQEIAAAIDEYFWGIEYDTELYRKTISEMKAYLLIKGIEGVTFPNLYNADALTFITDKKFDYILGNPPYIRIHNMDPQLRENVKRFAYSSGMPELYVIFFELGIRWLEEDGMLSFITPNSFMKNISQGPFREEIISSKLLEEIVDFGGATIFEDAATYTAITILSKRNIEKRSEVIYSFRDGKQEYVSTSSYDYLLKKPSKPFAFSNMDDLLFVQENHARETKLSDVCLPQYGIMTLRDKLFLNFPDNVEKELRRPVVKGSAYKGEALTKEILFPYKKIDGRFIAFTEEELAHYPNAYAHFLANKEELLTRTVDKNANWFQYGRSQGLGNIDKEKVTISHILRGDQTVLKAHFLPAEAVVYSGLMVTETGKYSLAQIKEILESEDFCKFALVTGKDMAGGFRAMSVKTLKEYGII